MRPLAYTLTDAQGPLTPPPPDASPQQRVPTLRVLIVTVRAATMAGKLALEGYREGVAGKVHVHRPPPPAHHLPSTHLSPSVWPWGCTLPSGGFLPGSTTAVGRRE